MSMTISVFHFYGLLISEESAALMLNHILPTWEVEKPELYQQFSSEDSIELFYDYLTSHYPVYVSGNTESMSCCQLCDGKESEICISESFCLMDLDRYPTLFHTAYTSFEEIVKECQIKLGNLLPADFPYEKYLVEIVGEVWG